MGFSRRQYLGALGSTAGIAVAGCVDDDDSDDDESEEAPPELRINGRVLNTSFPMELYEPGTDNRIADVHWHGRDFSHWHRTPLYIPLSEWKPYEIRLHDDDLETIPLGPQEQFQAEVARTEETSEDLIEAEVTGEIVNIRGESEGTGEIVFHITSDGEIVWTTPALPIDVSEAHEPH